MKIFSTFQVDSHGKMFVRKLVSVNISKISYGYLFPMPGDPQMGTEQKTLEAVIQVMLKMQGHPPQRKSQKSDDGYGRSFMRSRKRSS
ncbi:hypothetical protein OIU85_017506 [Salix viminalis]|uniref:Uncharacterized protein n=1 Tax=Salix viminalis TaxID=40686 RepID=A0A9Q0V7U1_SALVM|nr:hypothetical protein OIU85_017506 [Salix viminalis]